MLGHESEYFDSSDLGTYSKTNKNNGVYRRRKTNSMPYDPSIDCPLWCVGMKFTNTTEFRHALRK